MSGCAAPMRLLGEHDGVKWFWAEPGEFVEPGVYYWDGENNVRVNMPNGGVALIAAERRRQIEIEGWTPKHDDDHQDGAMAVVATCYAMPPGRLIRRMRPSDEAGIPTMWPWHPAWWKPKDRIRDLVRAGALIVAEIERIQRRQAAGKFTFEGGVDDV